MRRGLEASGALNTFVRVDAERLWWGSNALVETHQPMLKEQERSWWKRWSVKTGGKGKNEERTGYPFWPDVTFSSFFFSKRREASFLSASGRRLGRAKRLNERYIFHAAPL